MNSSDNVKKSQTQNWQKQLSTYFIVLINKISLYRISIYRLLVIDVSEMHLILFNFVKGTKLNERIYCMRMDLTIQMY